MLHDTKCCEDIDAAYPFDFEDIIPIKITVTGKRSLKKTEINTRDGQHVNKKQKKTDTNIITIDARMPATSQMTEPNETRVPNTENIKFTGTETRFKNIYNLIDLTASPCVKKETHIKTSCGLAQMEKKITLCQLLDLINPKPSVKGVHITRLFSRRNTNFSVTLYRKK